MAMTLKPGLPEPRHWKRQLRHRWRDWRWHQAMRSDPELGGLTGTATPDPDMPELAVGAVAMGSKYADWCLTMLTTLRERGAYRGPVYVITDLPELFKGLDNVIILAAPPTRHRLIAKACKQVLMQYVREPVMLYLDSDLVLTSPLLDWYRAMKPCLEQAPVMCYPDGKPCDGAFHGGLVLFDTQRGMPIIERWQGAVRTGRWGSDQACLYSVADEDGPGHLPFKGFTFLRGLLVGDTEVECIVHIANGVIREVPAETLKSYLANQLGVSRLPESFT